jgi:hypothetical protein
MLGLAGVYKIETEKGGKGQHSSGLRGMGLYVLSESAQQEIGA